MSQKDALALAFPDGRFERRVAYLNDKQRKTAEKSGRVKIESAVWPYYVSVSTRGPATYAYFETHVVRTMTETFMAVVDENGEVRQVELLAFAEPDDYLPSPRWLGQFKGRWDGLYVGRTIRNITGASLTSQAMTEAVRRVLAVHAVVVESLRKK